MARHGAPFPLVVDVSLDALKGALADRYTIERELGAGGMATVYLAHDRKHDRQVAIKVLRPELAAVIGAERFLAEIKTTANLQHPHILPLFDSGVADSFLFYVMPYVEGVSLRDRITREHQLPVEESVRLAREIAAALDYAHRQGVIHRDIKPENILLHDGSALVADFGIALAMANTTGTRMTETGMSLGTPHYMSPEQAMGEREITARSDVYALGAITYEMLCGEPPFTGPTAQAIIARVMTEEPRALTGQRKSIPPHVEAAIFTALEKLPADRFGSAADFASALVNVHGTSIRTAAVPAAANRRRWLSTGVAAVALLALGLLVGRRLAPAPAPGTLVRATLELGDSVVIRPISDLRLAISPEGERVVFVGSDGDDATLWVRDLDAPRARKLDGTTGASAPFFSPDGRSIGFFANGRILVVSVAGGAIRTVVADSVSTFGAAWGDDDQIYFSDASRGLSRVSSAGGAVTKVAMTDSTSGVMEFDYPDVLPGSKQAFVMLWKGSLNSNAVGVVDLETGTVTELADGSYPRYLAPDRIAIGAPNGQLLVAGYDRDARRLRAPPVIMQDDVQSENANGTVQFAVGRNGTLIYQRRIEAEDGIAWVDREGAVTPFDSTLRGGFIDLALSPNARQLSLTVTRSGGSEIWVKQLTTGGFSRLSLDLENANRSTWTADGRHVAYLGTANGRRSAWIRRADGSDSARKVVPGTGRYDEVGFSADGRYTLLRSEGSAVGTRDLLVYEEGVDRLPRPLLDSRFDYYAMALSPDGRWLAYVSDESGGRAEVYVRPFPNVDSAKYAISTAGGIEPIWRRDGRELFYRDIRGGVFAVTIGEGPTFAHDAPTQLFVRPEMGTSGYFRAWDVHPDGKRFLMLRSGGESATSLAMILNWPQPERSREVQP